ncbi:terminase small subunit [Acinetobacter sp. HY1485]|uniref:terminase small subunit n=1 Tax=Acinetobacter sp. HY1485 TaxID=2970918 RepID=UPI0022B9D381|nr:terminase small subunit [Acinetobacter sp. HY1485]
MALTPKMSKFAEAIVEGKSKKDAAISAGYNPSTASQQASKLNKNPDVLAYIDELTQSKKLTAKKVKVNSKNEVKLTPEKKEVKPTQDSVEPDEKLEIPIGAIEDPLEFLKAVWMDETASPSRRMAAAIAGLPYVHGKVASKGKKETRIDEAKDKAKGTSKFGTLNSQLPS